jgi:hypothetical protein
MELVNTGELKYYRKKGESRWNKGVICAGEANREDMKEDWSWETYI